MSPSLPRKSVWAALPVAGLLVAAVPVADAASARTTAAKAPALSASTYAVTVTVQSGHATISAHGIANTAAHTADLTTRLPSGRTAEARFVGGKAYLHLNPAGTPWLSVDPGALGIPISGIWAAAKTHRFTVKLGSQHHTTLTITLIPAAAHPVQAPSEAVDMTSEARDLGPMAREILGLLTNRN
jgi:hypothetical protein